MALSTQPYKGARDFYPEDKRQQKYIFNKIREVVERFGYEEYDAPILEPTDLYLAKGNQEIIDEQTYSFQDRGGRNVTIRTEMTPSVSRMVAAKRQELAYPLRWYSIPNLWRYERPQRGRSREFWQLNVDIFGVDGIEAEFEVIQITDQIFKAFGARPEAYEIKLSSRKLVTSLMGDYLSLNDDVAIRLIRLIDRMKKLERGEFIKKLDEILPAEARAAGKTEKLLAVLEAKQLSDLPDELRSNPSVTELEKLMALLSQAGVANAVFDITLMRGFDYYTDIVFEVFDTNPENNRSMMGGGRYDGLVGQFGVAPVATVGFGLGDATLANFLEANRLLPELKTETDVYIVLIGDVFEKAQAVVAELRKRGLNVAVDVSGRKIGDQFKTAEKKGITYALMIGDKDLEAGKFNLKNLKTGDEQNASVADLTKVVRG
ncbi:MAG: histidyl-tRNA synthetase [Candidatus Saccharibacteria bacterium]|nr:histidyl-tRNA synthetase [Candidatus Saccharibacteria bacterium]